MSVINQVLKDLEKRGATDGLDDPAVRVVYYRSSREILLWILTGAIGMLFLVGIVWLVYSALYLRAETSVPAVHPGKASSLPEPVVAQVSVANAPAARSIPAVDPVPEISSISPAIMPATGLPRKLVVYGVHFNQVARVSLRDNHGVEYADREILNRNDSMLELKVNVGKTAGTWQVLLTDRSARTGKPFPFEAQLNVAVGNRAAEKDNVSRPEMVAPREAAAAQNATDGQVEKHATRISLQQQAENEYRRSLQLQHQGLVSEALIGYENAIKLDPSHEPARLAMASMLIEMQRLDDAEKLMHEGLLANAQQTRLALLLARLQVERKESGAALETLQVSQQFAFRDGEYLSFHAALLQKMGRHQEAIGLFTKAVQLNPGNAVWQMGLGISLRAENRKEEARTAFQSALDSNRLSDELRNFVQQQLKSL